MNRLRTAARSKIVRSTVVTGMPSTSVTSRRLKAVVSCTVSPGCCARRQRGHVISAISSRFPGRSQSAAADRWDATARSPPAQHAARTSPFHDLGAPATRYTSSYGDSHRPIPTGAGVRPRTLRALGGDGRRRSRDELRRFVRWRSRCLRVMTRSEAHVYDTYTQPASAGGSIPRLLTQVRCCGSRRRTWRGGRRWRA